MHLENIKTIHIDTQAYLKVCNYKYDIVFADPPYNLDWLPGLPDMVMSSGIIKEIGIFILEHPGAIVFTSSRFFYEHRNYGKVNFSFFRVKP